MAFQSQNSKIFSKRRLIDLYIIHRLQTFVSLKIDEHPIDKRTNWKKKKKPIEKAMVDLLYLHVVKVVINLRNIRPAHLGIIGLVLIVIVLCLLELCSGRRCLLDTLGLGFTLGLFLWRLFRTTDIYDDVWRVCNLAQHHSLLGRPFLFSHGGPLLRQARHAHALPLLRHGSDDNIQ